jgi:drug/metabolite transporter (DMT)-like permease
MAGGRVGGGTGGVTGGVRGGAHVKGIVAGAVAGAAWGVVFLAPELVRAFTPFQLAVARYAAYGLFALLLVAPRLRTLVARITPAQVFALVWLSILGNLLYYVLLATAVQLGGVAMTSLVIGFMPVAVTWIGSRGEGALPLRRLAPSLLLGIAGIACVAWQSLAQEAGPERTSGLIGLLCAIGALVSWTAYAIGNRQWLQRLQHVSAYEWNLLTGLATGAMALLLLWPAFHDVGGRHDAAGWWHFIGIAAGLALVASIVGNAFWNRASRLLPLTMIGQMILFETLFALLYGFAWEARWPTPLELAAMVLVSASVLTSVSAHRTPASA